MRMQIWGALDILDGKVVILSQGLASNPRIVSHDPVRTALELENRGVYGVHVVDLDAALGIGNNRETIFRLIDALNVPIEVGGGVRRLDDATSLVRAGVTRIVIGTLPLKSAEETKLIINSIGRDKVVAALDYSNGLVRTNGWKIKTDITLSEAIRKVRLLGIECFIITAIDRDGTDRGPDLHTYCSLLRQFPSLYLFAAGGIRDSEDISILGSAGVAGVVIGKALYEGRLDFGKTNSREIQPQG
jgi:phosphoribosylformimino-5-aminoimidazole carboxamide ribotide isomerase